MRAFASFAAALFLFFSLSAFADDAVKPGAIAWKTESSIPYRSAAECEADPYMAERCVVDVCYPDGQKGFATAIWFHGGGLTSGDKGFPPGMKQGGFAGVAVRYRLSPKVKSELCIDDAAAAIAWTLKNIERYGGDPAKVIVSGHSAGGYLALMAGLDKRWLAKYGVDADSLAGLAPFSAQTVTHFNIRKERGIGEKTPVVDEFAPLYHVRKDAPPILLMTGDREMEILGRYEENAYLMRMLKVCGHKDVTLYEFQGYGHNMIEPGIKPFKDFIARLCPKEAKQLSSQAF